METRLASCLTRVILFLLSPAALPARQTAPAFKAETNLVLAPLVVQGAEHGGECGRAGVIAQVRVTARYLCVRSYCSD
jgi:hypothetical protein